MTRRAPVGTASTLCDAERLRHEIAAVELELAAANGAMAFRDRIAEEVRNAMDRAAAGVLYEKPWAAVSAAEIEHAAKSDYVAVGDRPKTDKAQRAAYAAGLRVLAAYGLFPQRRADYAADVFALLDRGEAEGLARPAPSRTRRKGAARRDQIAAAVAEEVRFTMGARDVSREHALALVTGARRPGAAQSPKASPLIPFRPSGARRDGGGGHAPYSHARRLLEQGERLLGPVALAFAQSQGKAAGQVPPSADPDYMRDREGRLALLGDPVVRRWLSGKARDMHNLR
jgi:hypothetical protein